MAVSTDHPSDRKLDDRLREAAAALPALRARWRLVQAPEADGADLPASALNEFDRLHTEAAELLEAITSECATACSDARAAGRDCPVPDGLARAIHHADLWLGADFRWHGLYRRAARRGAITPRRARDLERAFGELVGRVHDVLAAYVASMPREFARGSL